MRYISMIIIILGLGFGLAGQSSSEGDSNTGDAFAILESLEFPIDEKVGFVDLQSNPLFKQPIEQTGRLWLEHNNVMVMQVEHPRKEERRLQDNQLTLVRPDQSPTPHTAITSAGSLPKYILKPDHPGHLVLLSMLALFSGDMQMLQKSFSFAVVEISSKWKIKLIPLDAEIQKELLHIELSGEGVHLQSMYADRGAKGWQKLTIQKH